MRFKQVTLHLLWSVTEFFTAGKLPFNKAIGLTGFLWNVWIWITLCTVVLFVNVIIPSFGLFFWIQLFRVVCSKIVVDSVLQIKNQELYSWHWNFANYREWYPSSVDWRVMLWNYSLPSPAFFLSFLTDSNGCSWESPRSFCWAAWMSGRWAA